MGKVLIVEDDDYLRSSIVLGLRDTEHSITGAPNGRIAREVLIGEKFDVVVTDIQMPHFSGVELIEWTKIHSPTQFIVVTGFSNLLSQSAARMLGVNDYLLKPFKIEDLVNAISRLCPSPKAGRESREVSFCKIAIAEVIARPQVGYDVFIKLAADKFVKIANAGSQIEFEKLEQFKKKGVDYLYLKNEDFTLFLKKSLQISRAVGAAKDIDSEKKMKFLKHTSDILLQKVFVEGVDKDLFEDTNRFMMSAIDVVSDGEVNVALLNSLNEHSDDVYAHSLGVSAFAVMIAKSLAIGSPTHLFNLAMAGMFHDVGLKEIAPEMLKKPRHLMTQLERKLYESHPLRGREILSELPGILPDLGRLVLEHHEDTAGLGFPQGIKDREMHPLSRFLQAAVIFCETATRNNGLPPRTACEIIAEIEERFHKRIDPECLSALRRIFLLPAANSDRQTK